MKIVFEKKVIAAFILVVMAICASGCMENGFVETSTVTWCWGETWGPDTADYLDYPLGNDFFGNLEKTQIFIDWAKSEGIDRVYLYTDLWVTPQDYAIPAEYQDKIWQSSPAQVVYDPCSVDSEKVAETLRAFHEADITVEALMLGDHNYILPFYRGAAMERVESVLYYQADHVDDPDACFDALHLDLEPWNLGAYWSNPSLRPTAYTWILDLIYAVKAEAADSSKYGFPTNYSLDVFGDMAAIWDAEDINVENMTYNSVTKDGWQHIIDAYDGVVLMAYRDDPEGFVNFVSAELEYIEQNEAKPTWFANSFDSTERFVATSSFYHSPGSENNNSYEDFRRVRDRANIYLSEYSFLTGNGIHHYWNYRNWLAEQGEAASFAPIPFECLHEAVIPPSTQPTNPVQVKLNIIFPYNYVFFWAGGGFVVNDAGRLIRVAGPGYAASINEEMENLSQFPNAKWGRQIPYTSIYDDPSKDYDGVTRLLTLEAGEQYTIRLAGFDLDLDPKAWTVNSYPCDLTFVVPDDCVFQTGNEPIEMTIVVGNQGTLSRTATSHRYRPANNSMIVYISNENVSSNNRLVIKSPSGNETIINCIEGIQRYVLTGLNASTDAYTVKTESAIGTTSWITMNQASVIVSDGSAPTVTISTNFQPLIPLTPIQIEPIAPVQFTPEPCPALDPSLFTCPEPPETFEPIFTPISPLPIAPELLFAPRIIEPSLLPAITPTLPVIAPLYTPPTIVAPVYVPPVMMAPVYVPPIYVPPVYINPLW